MEFRPLFLEASGIISEDPFAKKGGEEKKKSERINICQGLCFLSVASSFAKFFVLDLRPIYIVSKAKRMHNSNRFSSLL